MFRGPRQPHKISTVESAEVYDMDQNIYSTELSDFSNVKISFL